MNRWRRPANVFRNSPNPADAGAGAPWHRFFGLSEHASTHYDRVRAARGVERFAAFMAFLSDLANCSDFRLLSSVQIQSTEDDATLDLITAVLYQVTKNVAHSMTVADCAKQSA